MGATAMKSKSIRGRFVELERGRNLHEIIVVCSRVDETSDQAIKREIAAGKFTKADRDNRLIVVITGLGKRVQSNQQ